ncbi:hypothetical protein DUI87_25571 [Hirundo rustica rustica]|uniref:Zona pellucida sperm-binding protein 1/4 Ig-like domain-containing protein n=1 Tax=Hirundo rustica rustica TaxID=333673 RepID=A0A3M0JGI8_HIRRU|nr:hypothetical protein DUI87_25571 [Hirundo rustica rustica]
MGRSCSFLLLLFLLPPWPRATVALLQYRHDCGELGMQLLVFPPHGRSVRFKVLDEFGSRFDVANCSICLHWLNSREDGSVIFSSGYKGCHVLFKENRYILRVQLEELLSSGMPLTSYEVNMTCPKPGGSETLPGGKRDQARDNGVLVSHQVSEASRGTCIQALYPQTSLGWGIPGAKTNQGNFAQGPYSKTSQGVKTNQGFVQGPYSKTSQGVKTNQGFAQGLYSKTSQGVKTNQGFVQGLYSKTSQGVKTNQGFVQGLYSKTSQGVKTNQGFAQGPCSKTSQGVKTNQGFAQGPYSKTLPRAKTNTDNFVQGLYPQTRLGAKTNQGNFVQGLYSKTSLGAKTNQGFVQGLYPTTLPGAKTNQGFALGLCPTTSLA